MGDTWFELCGSSCPVTDKSCIFFNIGQEKPNPVTKQERVYERVKCTYGPRNKQVKSCDALFFHFWKDLGPQENKSRHGGSKGPATQWFFHSPPHTHFSTFPKSPAHRWFLSGCTFPTGLPSLSLFFFCMLTIIFIP